ncbi:unnamed protein product [Adineta ricciae]|uniref:Multifunctional fusion protein n=1 Tax=Adineta ricciae TaxID=249248 RepID=A0A815U0A9_ADIRI|nr:unnamed protein product [Adineta ricciae]
MASLPAKSPRSSPKTRSSSGDTDSLEHSVEDITIIWFDQYMDESVNPKDVEKTKNLLRKVNDYVLFFSKPEPCIDYVKSVPKEKIFLISSGFYAVEHLDKIHSLSQIDSVFIFCVFRSKYEPLMEKYSKIIDVFTEHKDLMTSLTNNVELVTKQAAVFGLFDGKQRPTRYLTRESASFLWFQLSTDILKTMTLSETKNTGMEEMLTHCQIYYRTNRLELNNIEQFRKTYKPEDAIIWYSKQSFVYRSVNKALRTEDIDALYTFRVYITHLRTRIAYEHNQLRRQHLYANKKSKIIHLYRGLKMTNAEIAQMRENVGCLISMNGFFSTSRDMQQAIRFATKPSQRNEVVGVLLEIDGDITSDKMIFADISQFSAFPEEQEVLFDLATIFKIVHTEFDKGRNLWIIQLSGVEKSAWTVSEYIKSIGRESEETNPTLLFGRLMCDMGEYAKSERYLKRILSTLPKNHKDIANIYFYLGRVCYLRGQYKQALEYYDQALVLQKRDTEPEKQSLDIARTLHNIGNIYLDQRQTTKALEFYEQALEMKRAKLSDNLEHPSIATSLTAIGTIHRRRGDLNKALELYQQSYEIKKLALPTDHPSIADSLNNLGIVYEEMDDYAQALDCYKKSLQIKQKTLPSTHPSISATLNNMGIIYRKEGNYDQSLNCYTQALQIEQSTLSSDNLDLADTYNNLCVLYYDQFQYEKALDMAHCKLDILKKHFTDDDEQVIQTNETIKEIKQELNLTKKATDVYF